VRRHSEARQSKKQNKKKKKRVTKNKRTSSSFAFAFNTVTKKSLLASWYLSRISVTESVFALEPEVEAEDATGAEEVEAEFELLEDDGANV